MKHDHRNRLATIAYEAQCLISELRADRATAAGAGKTAIRATIVRLEKAHTQLCLAQAAAVRPRKGRADV